MIHSLKQQKKNWKINADRKHRLFTKTIFLKLVFNMIWLMAKSNNLPRRTESDKVLRDKACGIASDPKYDRYQIGVASMVCKFFDEKSSGSGVATVPKYQIENELHRQIIRQFKGEKVYYFFRGSIWGLDFADMQSLTKYNRGIRYLLCEIALLSEYSWFVPLKDKRGISILNAFKKIMSKGSKPNKTWVDKVSEFKSDIFKKLTFQKLSFQNKQ